MTSVIRTTSPFRTKSIGGHSYGCLLAPMPPAIHQQVTSWAKDNIPDCDLGLGGREDQIHVTVKYGFTDSSIRTTMELTRFLTGWGPINILLTDFSLFTGGEDGDVLKVDIESPELHRLNAAITARFPCVDKYPTYIPHMTVAYLNPEVSPLYDGPGIPAPFTDQMVTLDFLEFFSGDGGEHARYQLSPRKALSAFAETAGGALVRPPRMGRLVPGIGPSPLKKGRPFIGR